MTNATPTAEEIVHVNFPTRRERALHSIVVATVLAVIIVSATFWVDASTAEKITQASQMVLQFDSFLAGGWIVGFFFFWGNFGKELRELRRLSYRVKAQSSKHLSNYLKMESWEKRVTNVGGGVFGALALGVVNFIVSGILAVGSVLTSNGTLLVASLAALVGGTGLMFESWYRVHNVLDMLSVLSDKLTAYLEVPAAQE